MRDASNDLNKMQVNVYGWIRIDISNRGRGHYRPQKVYKNRRKNRANYF